MSSELQKLNPTEQKIYDAATKTGDAHEIHNILNELSPKDWQDTLKHVGAYASEHRSNGNGSIGSLSFEGGHPSQYDSKKAQYAEDPNIWEATVSCYPAGLYFHEKLDQRDGHEDTVARNGGDISKMYSNDPTAGFNMAKQIEERYSLDDSNPGGHADAPLKDTNNTEERNKEIIARANETLVEDHAGMFLEYSQIFEGHDLRLIGMDGSPVDENKWGAFPEYHQNKTP